MGYQRIFACARSDASAQRLASGAHWNQEALPYLLFLVHTVLRSVRLELVCGFLDWLSRSAGHQWRTNGAVDAAHDSARRGKTHGAGDGLRSSTCAARTHRGPSCRGCDSAACVLALAFPYQPADRCAGDCTRLLFFFLRMTTEHDLKEVLIWWVF